MTALLLHAGRVLVLAGAVGAPAVVAGAEPTGEQLVRGFVQTTDASGVWTLRRCDEASTAPVEDQTPGQALTVAVAEIKRGMQEPRRGVFVEFQGAATRNAAVARRMWRVVGYVVDCTKLPENIAADATFWASGSDPVWRLVVRSKSATFTRSGRERLAFSAASLTPQMPRRRYEAQAGTNQLTLEIDEEICLDAMAETAYGARATVTVREKGKTQTLRGCAARY